MGGGDPVRWVSGGPGARRRIGALWAGCGGTARQWMSKLSTFLQGHSSVAGRSAVSVRATSWSRYRGTPAGSFVVCLLDVPKLIRWRCHGQYA